MSTNAMSFETKQSPWWLILMGGLLNIAVGLLLLTAPVKTVFVLVLALGIYWIFAGIFTLVEMFMDHTAWGWKLLTGLISIFAGVTILRYPLMSVLAVPAVIVLMLGIQGFIVGAVSLVMAFRGGGLGAAILGILSMLFGAILIANFTSPGMILTLVWVAAITALAGGIIEVVLAFRQRSA